MLRSSYLLRRVQGCALPLKRGKTDDVRPNVKGRPARPNPRVADKGE